MTSEFNQEPSASGTEVNTEPSGNISKAPSSSSSDQWKAVGEQASELLRDVPGYASDFYSEYKPIIFFIGILLGAFLFLKVYLAILGVINSFPLLPTILETIGLIYAGWFVIRYLSSSPKRKELSEDFTAVKEKVFGKAS